MKNSKNFIKTINPKKYEEDSFSDEDINALFCGVLNIIKEKIVKDCDNVNYNLQLECDMLKDSLQKLRYECNTLKNENLYLKTIINNLK